MATRGRNICNTLKAIRKQIADANGISYSPEECHFKGECMGTCPKCEQDVRDLEYELHLKQMAGKAIKVAGIAVGLVAMTACSDGKVQRISSDATQGELNIVKEEVPKPGDRQLEGDISFSDEAKYAEEEENLKSATKPFNILLACTRPLTTEFSYKLRQKCPLLPTTPPYPIMRLETIRSIIPISCRRHPKSVWNTSA